METAPSVGDVIEVTTRAGRSILAEVYDVRETPDGSRHVLGWLIERNRRAGGAMLRAVSQLGADRVVSIHVGGRFVPQATVTPKRDGAYSMPTRHVLAGHAVRTVLLAAA